MLGKIIKIHSDFYYVKLKEENIILECKIREKLKKEKMEIFVGDFVRVEKESSESNQAVIVEVFPRNNYLPRPSIANVDQIIVVAALSQGKFDFEQLNRYLCQAKLYDIPVIISINKSDLDETLNFKQKILDIYNNIGYKVVFTSALTGLGIDELKIELESKISVLCGMSGVGKTSLLNKIHPALKFKTKEISSKTGKGTHTTRHVEIIEVFTEEEKFLQIADTPGFSHLKFDTVMPSVINELFDEIKELSSGCNFANCLHLNEEGCNVISNLNKIDSTRYESYKIFTNEAVEYKEKLRKEGHKQEKFSKFIDKGNKETKQIVKINAQSRKKARNTEKQKINIVSILDEIYYNQEDFD